MKTNLKFVVFFTLLIQIIYGFTSINSNIKNCVKVISIDSNTFTDYYCIFLKEMNMNLDFPEKKGFYILSRKENYINFSETKYELLKENNLYLLCYTPIDTSIEAKKTKSYDRGGGESLYIDDELFWENGKIVKKVFSSNDITGIYILKGKQCN